MLTGKTMALTNEQADEKADNEFALKISIEASLSPLLASLFDSIVSISTNSYLQNGVIPTATDYLSNFNDFFDTLYTTTVSQFRDSLNDEMSSFEINSVNPNFTNQDLISQVQNNSDLKIDSFIQVNSSENANQVTQTNQEDIDNALAIAIASQLANGLNRAETANVFSAQLSSYFNGRSGTILATGVQNASEGSKQIVSEQYSTIVKTIDPNATGAVKIWVTKMDDKVRVSHREANFQSQLINTPFIVQDELLRYPGDTSMGASLNNVINCRCVSVFSL